MEPASTANVSLDIGFPLKTEFPLEWKQIVLLPDINSVSPNVLTEALGPIIYRHRRMFSDKTWVENIKSFIQAADATVAHLDSMRIVLTKLDQQHRASFMIGIEWLEDAVNLPPSERTLASVIACLSKLRKQLFVYRIALSMATGITEKGQPKTQAYFLPTWELMDVWQSLTGQPVGSPKGSASTKNDEPKAATQDPTEFIRLCLLMIDPAITRHEKGADWIHRAWTTGYRIRDSSSSDEAGVS